jgi:hypothetical protein
LVARTTDYYEGDLLIHAVTEEGGALACPLAETFQAVRGGSMASF